MLAFLIRHGGVNRAVAFSLLLRIWQSAAGLLTLFFISVYFRRDVQGFYYTFASLIALQSFFELGLTIVITNAASHEWSSVRLGETGSIHGDPRALSRLVSLGRFVFQWYGAAAGVFFVLASAGGYWFLSRAQAAGIAWQAPWLVHIACSSLLLWCGPFLSLLEGCDQVGPVAQFRLVQSVVGSCVSLLAIRAGANLWAAPALSSISALSCVLYLVVTRRRFFMPFFRPPAMDRMNWRVEIWPMQWRLASQALVTYFLFSLFTPVIFHYRGPIEAGQMGMSFQLVTAVQSIASIWIMTKVPRFGVLVARREFGLLDVEWRKASWLSVYVMVTGIALLLGALFVVNRVRPEAASRVLPPAAFAMLALGAVFSLGSQPFALYLRAHKREVLMASSFASAGAMGILVWQLGARFGSLGVTASYLFVMSCVAFPTVVFIWRRSRKEWH